MLMINGSPVKDGCIHTALAIAAEEFAAAGIECKEVQVGNKAIRGCIACTWALHLRHHVRGELCPRLSPDVRLTACARDLAVHLQRRLLGRLVVKSHRHLVRVCSARRPLCYRRLRDARREFVRGSMRSIRRHAADLDDQWRGWHSTPVDQCRDSADRSWLFWEAKMRASHLVASGVDGISCSASIGRPYSVSRNASAWWPRRDS